MKSEQFHLPKCTFFIYLFSFLAIIIFNYSCQDKSLAGYEDVEFNVIEFEPISVNKTINLLETLLNKKAKKKNLPMQLGDVKITYANIEKSKKELGYNPTTNIRDGLKSFVDWYKNYKK